MMLAFGYFSMVEALRESAELVHRREHLLDVLVAVLAEGLPEYGRCVPHLPRHSGLRTSAPSAHNCAGARGRGVAAAGKHVL